MNMAPVAPRAVMSDRRVTLIGASLIAIGPVSMALFTPAMPEIVRAFGTTEAAVKMTLSFYFAGFAIAQLFCGPLSDGLGRKPVTFGFMGIFLVGSICALFAPTIETLIAARFLQGVGSAVGVSISRALVRDLYTHDKSTGIMNLMAMILAVAPAIAPTIGGLTMEAAGWQAIFILMVVAGVAILLIVHFAMIETVARDLSRIRPGELARSYASLLGSGYFILCSLILGGTVGAIYTQTTVLPFVLMNKIGLTPSQFGLAMLVHAGSYFLGTLLVRRLIPRIGAAALVPIGLTCVGVASVLLATLLRIEAPNFYNVMLPIGLQSFGVAQVVPSLATAALAPFPRIAGAASSLNGFMQLGGGLVGGLAAALIGDPVMAIATILPAMSFFSVAMWLLWRRLPEPALRT